MGDEPEGEWKLGRAESYPGLFHASQQNPVIEQAEKQPSEPSSRLNGDSLVHIGLWEKTHIARNTNQSSDIFEKYRLIALSSSDLIAFTTFDQKLIYTFVSPSHKKILGFEAEDLLGKSGLDIIHEDDKKYLVTLLRMYIDAKTNGLLTEDMMKNTPRLEYRIRDKGGQWHFIQSTVDIVNNELLLVSKDLTEKKQIEAKLRENEKRLSAVIQGLSIAAFFLGRDHKVIFWNKALEDLSRIRAEDVIGTVNPWKAFYAEKRPVLADLLIEDNIGEAERWYAGRFEKSSLLNESYEAYDFFPHLGVNGKWLRFAATSIRDPNGELVGVLETLEDISERKKAEIALQDSEKKYRLLFDSASDGIMLLDFTGKIINVNDMIAQIIGVSKEELIGKNFKELDLISLKDLQQFLAKFALAIAGNNSAFNMTIRNKKGELKYLETAASTVIRDGKKIGVMVVVHDISKRKQAEEELQKSEERFRLAVSSITDILYEWDFNTGTIQWFGDIDSQLKYEKGIFPQTLEAFLKFIHPEDVNNVQAIATQGLQSHQKWQGEYRVVNKTGVEFYWHGTGIGIYDEEGNPITVVGAVTDITERKRAEKELQESEKKFKSIFDNSNDGFISVDLENKRFFNANRKMIEMLGYESEEDIKNLTVLDIHPEKDLSYILREFEKHARGEISRSENLPVKRKDGSIFFASISSSLIRIANKEYLSCIFIDITERKRAEDALRRSEERYRLVTENASDVIWTMDLNLRFTYFSPSNEKLTGYPPEKALTLSLGDLLTPESMERALKTFAAEMQLENSKDKDIFRSVTLELDEIRADGTIFPIEARMRLFRDAHGNPIGILGITRDITERKKQEETLKKSEEKFVKAFKASPVAISITRLKDGKFIEINESFERFFGYSREELFTQTAIEAGLWLENKDREYVVKELSISGLVHGREFRFRTKRRDCKNRSLFCRGY